MAELLVKAVDAWGTDKTRSMKGDVIVVRPDGWRWGREECLPRFIVVKVPQMTEAEAKRYEESLFDTTDKEKPVMLKVRKYNLDPTVVDDVNLTASSHTEFTKTAVLTKITEKVS